MRDTKLPKVMLERLQLLLIRHKFLCFDAISHVEINRARSTLCHESLAQLGEN